MAKIKTNDLFYTFLAFFTIYFSGTIFDLYFFEQYRTYLKISFIIISYFIIFVKIIKQKKKIYFVPISIMAAIMTIVVMKNNVNTMGAMLFVITFVLYSFIFSVDRNGFVNLINKVNSLIFLLAIFYLILWLIVSILGIEGRVVYLENSNTIAEYISYGDILYQYGYIDIYGHKFSRLSGPFWEAGVFQIYLNFSIFYHLFLKEKISLKTVIPLVIATIMTTSTMGWLILLLLICVYVYRNKKLRKYCGIFGVPIALILGSSILIEKMSSSSFAIRIQEFYNVGQLLQNNILFGHGYMNVGISTNSIFGAVLEWGLIGLLLLVFLIRGFWPNDFNHSKQYGIFAFLIWSFLSLINEPMYSMNFFILFFAHGFLYYICNSKIRLRI